LTVLIEDSPRNLLAWIIQAGGRGLAAGAVISPFASPRVAVQHRRSAEDMAAAIHDSGGEVWFDATTHALQMAGVGDFRYYDEYPLWGGTRGDLSSRASQHEHVRLVFAEQDRLGARHLVPTMLLHSGLSATSQITFDLAEFGMTLDDAGWITIAGTSPFWSSGNALDAHIGALAQLQPGGWFLVPVRTTSELPVDAQSEEVHGLCRTARALSEFAPVHVSHGDLAALPAVAAGASSVGTGWDQRQRACSYPGYAARVPGSTGGGWYERPTLRGLVGNLKPNEASVLAANNAALLASLGTIPAPGPQEAFEHHAAELGALVDALLGAPSDEDRFRLLTGWYASATTHWPTVQMETGSAAGAPEWIQPHAEGLARYGAGEGW
jgi:hypothetical protein